MSADIRRDWYSAPLSSQQLLRAWYEVVDDWKGYSLQLLMSYESAPVTAPISSVCSHTLFTSRWSVVYIKGAAGIDTSPAHNTCIFAQTTQHAWIQQAMSDRGSMGEEGASVTTSADAREI